MTRPNILLILTDQQRFDALGAVNPHVQTPHLDALAREGVVFTHTFCNAPVCMPSRQSLLSGQYPSAIGSTNNGVEMPLHVPVAPHYLKPFGYRSANIGKLHFLNHSNRDHAEPHPLYGFDCVQISDEPGCYDDAYIKWVEEHDPAQVPLCRCATPPAWGGAKIEAPERTLLTPYAFKGQDHLTHSAFVADQTSEFIRQTSQPWFCVAGFYAPHDPINPPQRFVDLYDPATLPLPQMLEGENKLGLSDDEWRRVKAWYYALVSHLDDEVGTILAALDESGQRDNTLIIFTSDHGEHLGDHGLVAKGPPGLDSCSRVPLLLSFRGKIAPGQKRDELVELVDLVPTICDYAGVPISPLLQGRSLRPLLENRAINWRETAFCEWRAPRGKAWKTLRSHDWKICQSNAGETLFFDLKNDHSELHNVAQNPDYSAPLAEMRRLLLERWFQVEAVQPIPTGAY